MTWRLLVFLRLKKTQDDEPVFVNPELVREVYTDGGTGETRIKFDKDHGVTVYGKPEEVVSQLDKMRK